MTPRVEVAVDAGAALGECPLWSPADAQLYWVDIDGMLLHRFQPSAGRSESRVLPGRPGSIARTTVTGRLLLAMETEVVWFDWNSGQIAEWLTLEPAGTGNRLNDGRTDPAGRFWVGSMYERSADQRFTGMLHRIDGAGNTATVRREIGVTNGLAFDADRNLMYFADTLHDSVWRYDYDVATGVASNETLFIDFTQQRGRPDGACIDADGCYWVAAVYGGALLRFTPHGVLDRIVELPVVAPSMPAFGGSDLGILFVTSIGRGASRPLPSSPVENGALLAIDAGVAGYSDVPFAGTPPPMPS